MSFWKFLLGLITFISLMGSLKANAESDFLELDFSINCKILDQILLEVKDGKSSRYDGFEDGLQVGETLVFNIQFDAAGMLYSLSIGQTNGATYQVNTLLTNTNFKKILKNQIFTWNNISYLPQHISNGYINIGDELGQISGSRYYKNDWNMLHETRHGQTGKLIRTLNCLNVSNDYNKILDRLVDVHSQTQKELNK